MWLASIGGGVRSSPPEESRGVVVLILFPSTAPRSRRGEGVALRRRWQHLPDIHRSLEAEGTTSDHCRGRIWRAHGPRSHRGEGASLRHWRQHAPDIHRGWEAKHSAFGHHWDRRWRVHGPHNHRGEGKPSGVGGDMLPMSTEARKRIVPRLATVGPADGGGGSVASSRRLRRMVIIVTVGGG